MGRQMVYTLQFPAKADRVLRTLLRKTRRPDLADLMAVLLALCEAVVPDLERGGTLILRRKDGSETEITGLIRKNGDGKTRPTRHAHLSLIDGGKDDGTTV